MLERKERKREHGGGRSEERGKRERGRREREKGKKKRWKLPGSELCVEDERE